MRIEVIDDSDYDADDGDQAEDGQHYACDHIEDAETVFTHFPTQH